MPTTSSAVIETVLTALGETDATWAVLHREGELLSGVISSDVDVITDSDPAQIIRGLSRRLHAQGVVLLQTWEYDVCERSSVFVDLATLESVQLDLVHDPSGRGVCGFRSDDLLRGAQPGVRWPTLQPIDGVLYRTRKRQVKRNIPALRDLAIERKRFSPDALTARAHTIFEPRAQAAVVSLLRSAEGTDPVGWHKGAKYWGDTRARRIRRIWRPPGIVVVVKGGVRAMEELRATLSRFVVESAIYPNLKWRHLPAILLRTRKPCITLVLDSRTSRLAAKAVPSIWLSVEGSGSIRSFLNSAHELAIKSL